MQYSIYKKTQIMGFQRTAKLLCFDGKYYGFYVVFKCQASTGTPAMSSYYKLLLSCLTACPKGSGLAPGYQSFHANLPTVMLRAL